MTTATPRKPAKRIGGAPFSLPRRWPSAEPAFAASSARERDRKAASASASPRKPALQPQLVAATPRGAQTARSARGDDARSVASAPYTARAEEYVSRLVGRTDGNASNEGALEWPLVVELDVADYLNQESDRRKRVQQQRLDNRAHLLEQQARQQRERDAGRSLRRQWREDLEADAERYRQEEEVKRAQNLEIRRRFDDERRIQLEHVQRQRRSQREADEREGREMVAAAQEAKRAEEEREEQRRLKERAVALKLAEEAEVARERKAKLLREEHQNDVRMAQAQQELLDQQERERSRAIEERRVNQQRLMERYEAGVKDELQRREREDEERAQRQQRQFQEREQALIAAKEQRLRKMQDAGKVAVQRQLEDQAKDRQRQREEELQFAEQQRVDAEKAERKEQASQWKRQQAALANAEFVRGQMRTKGGVQPFNLQRDQMNEVERRFNREKLQRAADPERPDGMQLLVRRKRQEYAQASLAEAQGR